MNTNKEIFSKFEGLKSASFIGIKGYVNNFGEVADITLNTNVSTEQAKEKDLESLKALTEIDLRIISVSCNQDLDLVRIALNELIASAEKNLSENFEDRTNFSKGQIDAYVNLGNGLKLHKESLDITICGFVNQKKVLVLGEGYKETKKQPKTICKDAIKKHCDLRMEKYRTYKLGKVESLRITGDTIQIL